MKRLGMRILYVLFFFVFVISFHNCGDEEAPVVQKFPLEGTWTNEYGGELTFGSAVGGVYKNDSGDIGTEDGYDYEGEIVEINIDQSYLIIEITKNLGFSEQVGNFTMIHWKNLSETDSATTVEYSEGYPQKESLDEARGMIDDMATYFMMYGTITKK